MGRTAILAERESAFVATVQEGTPYRWSALDTSLHLIGTLRLAQISYFPPTSLEALQAYVAADGASATASSTPAVYSVRAIVRTLTANNKVEDFVLACFPLEVRRLTDPDLFTVPPLTEAAESGVAGDEVGSEVAEVPPGPSHAPAISSLLPRQHDAFDGFGDRLVLPCATDVVKGLNAHIGLDGVTELRVEGPGTVVFTGEERIGMLSPSRREYDFSRQ